jgi:hypothetical protein
MSAHESQTNIFGQVPPQRELFHYTSAEGLKGIVSGRTLWATNIEYLNDTTEFNHGEDVIREVIASSKHGTKGDRREFFNTLEKKPSIFHAEDLFVISLSEEGDLLSQWRGYTPSNFGFSIGFDPQSLTEESQTLDKMELVQCVYDEAEQMAFAKSLLDSCLEMWIQHLKRDHARESSNRDLGSIISFKVYSTFAAAAMKHRTFAEEREWRLLGLSRDLERTCFRPGKSSLIPYIELKWDKETKAPQAQPITSVTVGPCPNPTLAAKSVSRLLRTCNLGGVQVKKSEIPFKSW